MLYNGTEFLTPRGGYTRGPWGPNGEEVSYPTRSVTLEMWALAGWLPLTTEQPPSGYRATGWEIVLEDGFYIKRPTGTEYGRTIEELKAEKHAAAQAEKCRARDAGFMVGETLFDSDLSARTAYLEIQVKFAANPALVEPWKASGSTWVMLDAALFAQVFAAGEAHVRSCFAWQAAKDAEIEAAETIEAALAIEIAYTVPVEIEGLMIQYQVV